MGVSLNKDQMADIVSRISKAEFKVGDLYYVAYVDVYDGEEDADNIYDIVNACGADGYDLGMSKICMYFDDYPDIVVKLPIRGATCYEEDPESDTLEWIENDTIDYSHAVVENGTTWDYCAAEEFIYNKAVVLGISPMFAQTMRIGTTEGGYPVYASEKIDDCPSKLTKPQFDKCLRYVRDAKFKTCLGNSLVANMVASYPIMMVMEAVEFMRRYNVDTDMHEGNYRFNENGDVVLIDYSDFNDSIV